MPELIELINVAAEGKPSVGEPCNYCGWCCLTEVCSVGVNLTGKVYGPCELLESDGDIHKCSLYKADELAEVIGMGTGCCAETQDERIAKYLGEKE